jgi:hypothetical protein
MVVAPSTAAHSSTVPLGEERRLVNSSSQTSLLDDDDDDDDDDDNDSSEGGVAQNVFFMIDEITGEEITVHVTTRAPTIQDAYEAMVLLLTDPDDDDMEDDDSEGGLTAADLIASTTVSICNATEAEAKRCGVCQDDMIGPTVVRHTVCKHVFHNSCLERAAMSSTTCPMCRRSLRAQDSGEDEPAVTESRLSPSTNELSTTTTTTRAAAQRERDERRQRNSDLEDAPLTTSHRSSRRR